MSCSRPHRRFGLFALLLSLCFLLSGCSYLRLLEFKNQLKDFDRFVAIETENGLSFHFHKPVLNSKDFVFLTGCDPTTVMPRDQDPSIATWIWRFEKDPNALAKDPPCSISFKTTFRDGLLERMEVDKSLLKAMDPEFVAAMLRSLGKARINKLKMAMRAEVKRHQAPKTRFPSLAAIKRVFGKPTRIREIKETAELENEYVFSFRDPQNHTVAGQFKVIFQGKDNLDSTISGFVLTGKGR